MITADPPLPETGWKVEHQALSNQFHFTTTLERNAFALEVLNLPHMRYAVISANEIHATLDILITIYGSPLDTGHYREKIDQIHKKVTEPNHEPSQYWWRAFHR